MSTTIKIKRGLKANLPVLEVGELAFCTDTNEFFIGTTVGNKLLNEDPTEPYALDSNLQNHIEDDTNPHSVTKTQVGLSNVDNTSDADKPISTATQQALDGKEPANANIQTHISATDNPHAVTKAQVGLGSVDNVQQIPLTQKGAANGVASLDANSKVPLAQLPDTAKQQTYVVATFANLPTTNVLSGDKGYVTGTGDSYIWNGSAWLTLAEADWENVNLDYGNITNPPTIGNGTLTLATSGIATGSQTFSANQTTNGTFTVNVPATNIAQGTRTTTTVPVTSSTGTNATLQAATTSLAGVMTSADKTKLDGIAAGAQVNVGTNLGQGGSGNSRTITSSTGNDVTVTTATTTNAGFMSTNDKSKLDGIAAGAQVNTVTSVAGKTGAVTLATGDITSGRFILDRMPTSATANRFLKVGTANTSPTFNTIVAADVPNLATSKITSGSFAVARGGTGRSTLTADTVLVGNGTSAVSLVSRSGIDTRTSFPADVPSVISNASDTTSSTTPHLAQVNVSTGSRANNGIAGFNSVPSLGPTQVNASINSTSFGARAQINASSSSSFTSEAGDSQINASHLVSASGGSHVQINASRSITNFGDTYLQINASSNIDADFTFQTQVNASSDCNIVNGSYRQINGSTSANFPLNNSYSQINSSSDVSANSSYTQINASSNVTNSTLFSVVQGTNNLQRIRLESNTGVGRFRGGTSTSGFDFAELFENGTGKEIGAGLLVTLDGDKVIPANEGQKAIGVVSHTYGFLGNGSDMQWEKAELRDEFGRIIMEWVKDPSYKTLEDAIKEKEKLGFIVVNEIPEEKEKGKRYITKEEILKDPLVVEKEKDSPLMQVPKKHPNYDPERNKDYVGREDRPDEWTPVGMLGQVYVRLNKEAKVGDNIKSWKDGVGQPTEEYTNIIVMKITQPYDKDKGYAIGFCLIK